MVKDLPKTVQFPRISVPPGFQVHEDSEDSGIKSDKNALNMN